VIDDRLDVWEEDSRKAVLQVTSHRQQGGSAPAFAGTCVPALHFWQNSFSH
jgi:hypothetical protein